MSDVNGHYILSGEQYAEVGYLQKKDEKKRVVRYQHPKKQQSIYIHVAQVFVTNVALDEDLSMDIYEYQSISNAALWAIYFTIKFQLFFVNKKCCLHDGSFCWLFYILIVLILKYSVSFLLFSTSKFNLIILWNCFIEPIDLKTNLTIWFDWVSMKANIKW